ncbi:hypothetical protein DL89DRAFT_60755 [Linderina pennispora]|uniref:Secreted protein n=1 Tax=Linderina pennispora TaxID=61395 RepID=A0A1Y1W001_9FUNG|nr:uncharacterized protein DL89DRAFT_60755 [Linderina pennispora]ORX66847.1 hypothetical protein DL89DRAFT_60755 [Linderina pennispora]
MIAPPLLLCCCLSAICPKIYAVGWLRQNCVALSAVLGAKDSRNEPNHAICSGKACSHSRSRSSASMQSKHLPCILQHSRQEIPNLEIHENRR